MTIFRKFLQNLRPCRYMSSHLVSNKYVLRSHNCGQLRASEVGTQVVLCGWIKYKRTNKFLVITDTYGSTQLYVAKTAESPKLSEIPLESVVSVVGAVKHRPHKDVNPSMETGEIEIQVSKLEVLNKAAFTPLIIRDYQYAEETKRLEYRYMDLRREWIQTNLKLRSQVLMNIRRFLSENCGFMEIDTPYLTSRTPGGAQEFVIPTRFPNEYYVLAQSPQQFKQLLMIGAMDRYFQIARCFRDEGSKPDRQPEFTQVDIELSFTSQEQVMKLIEDLFGYFWPNKLSTISLPFHKISYKDAMRYYGSDKPDLRLNIQVSLLRSKLLIDLFQLEDVNALLSLPPTQQSCCALRLIGGSRFVDENRLNKLKEKLSRICQQQFPNVVADFIKAENNVINCRVDEKLNMSITEALSVKQGDLVALAVGTEDESRACLGQLRNALIKEIGKSEIKPSGWTDYAFLWVVDFPLFLLKKGKQGLESAHHPFTAPVVEHLSKFDSDLLNVIGQHYDLVLNGEEIGGGSIRIHDADLQEHIFCNILKEEVSTMKYFFDALKSGCPPHGGIALGLDRILAIMCGASSIRDVIAFPKSGEGKDLMLKAPCRIDERSKVLYHIKE